MIHPIEGTAPNDGTVTIPLTEYHRFLKLEETLHRYANEPDTVLIRSNSFYDASWFIIRPDEATKMVAENLQQRIDILEQKLQSQPPLRVKKWYEVFGL